MLCGQAQNLIALILKNIIYTHIRLPTLHLILQQANCEDTFGKIRNRVAAPQLALGQQGG
jgi:hypothetical protein